MDFHNKPNMYVHDVSLNVTNLEESLLFYTKVIGLSILNKSNNKVELTSNGKDVLLTLIEPVGVKKKDPRSIGMYHFALLLPNRQELADVIYHIMSLGVSVGAGDHLVSEAFYLKDLDGNDIEIYVDRDPSLWTWHKGQVLMATDPIDVDKLFEEKTETPFDKLSDKVIMGHLHLYVSNLEESLKFYTEGLGLDVVSSLGDSAVFMSTGKYHHHIAINTWQGRLASEPEINSAGMESFTVIVNDNQTRDAIMKRVKDLGFKVNEDNYEVYDYHHNKIYLEI